VAQGAWLASMPRYLFRADGLTRRSTASELVNTHSVGIRRLHDIRQRVLTEAPYSHVHYDPCPRDDKTDMPLTPIVSAGAENQQALGRAHRARRAGQPGGLSPMSCTAPVSGPPHRPLTAAPPTFILSPFVCRRGPVPRAARPAECCRAPLQSRRPQVARERRLRFRAPFPRTAESTVPMSTASRAMLINARVGSRAGETPSPRAADLLEIVYHTRLTDRPIGPATVEFPISAIIRPQ
jgi:hypothetical protein